MITDQELHAQCCNSKWTFCTPKSKEVIIHLSLALLNFQTRSMSSRHVHVAIPEDCNFTGMFSMCIKVLNEFDVDYYLNFISFRTSSWSIDGSWQYFVSYLFRNWLYHATLQGCSSHKNLANFVDVDLCVTFMNFQASLVSNCLVKVITPQELYALCCNFKGIFSI